MDRRALRELVFADPAARARLDQITHPRIRELVQVRVAQAEQSAPYTLVVVPLMAEKGRYPFLREVIVVDCPVSLQLQRLMRRDGIDQGLAEQMLAAQATRAARLAIADHVLSNDGDAELLRAAILRLHERFLHG